MEFPNGSPRMRLSVPESMFFRDATCLAYRYSSPLIFCMWPTATHRQPRATDLERFERMQRFLILFCRVPRSYPID